MTALCGLLAVSLTAQAQTVDELIDKHIEASGGMEQLDALQTLKQTGEGAIMGMTVPFVVYQKRPGMMRNEVTIQGQTMVTGYDGDTAWQINPMTGSTMAQPLPEEQAAMIAQQADMDGILIGYEDAGYDVTYLGEGTVRDQAAYKLKVVSPSGQESVQYLDAETYLLVKTEAEVENPGMGVAMVETYLTDYRDVQGTRMPFAIETVMNGQSMQKLTLTEVEANVDLDDELFVMPMPEVD